MNYSDATGSKYYSYDSGMVGINKKFSVIKDYNPSKYITCSYSGKTESLRFVLNVGQGTQLVLNGITLNKAPAINISFIRVLFLYGIILLIYAVIYIPEFQKPFNIKDRRHMFGIMVSTFLFILVCVSIFTLYTGGINPKDFTLNTGDQVSQELVDAFAHGQVSLLEEPGQDILNLQNPYDYAQRSNTYYLWDHLLYNGKYYSYYGIAPVLLVFLPYYLLTGCYFPTYVLCLICSIIGAVFISMSYIALINRKIKNTPYSLVLCGNILLLFASGILFCVLRPSFYENAEAFGFMMFAAALYCTFTSGILNNEKIKIHRLVIASTAIALAVLSRPTFALYAVSYAVCIIWFLIGQRKQVDIKKNILHGAVIFLPLILFAVLQMVYNYMRFGSITDFGISYSLTINDFTNTTVRIKLVFLSLWNFLFGIPVINSTFPYLHGVKEIFGLNGSWFADTPNIFGVFWRVPILMSLVYIPKFIKLKGWKWKDTLKRAVIAGIPGILCPLIIIAATWESGHALRYNIDFASQMFLIAVIVSFTVYNRVKNENIKKLLRILMAACVCITIVSTVLLVFGYIPNVSRAVANSSSEQTMMYYKIKSVLSFWE